MSAPPDVPPPDVPPPDVPPPDVAALAERRAAARAAKDFAESDRLRDELAEAGWSVRDRPGGYTLTPRPPYDVLPSVDALPDRSGEPDTHRCTVALLVDGWPEDVQTCVRALLAHTPRDVRVVLLENGRTDAGVVVHELAGGRVTSWHVERPAGWGPARQALVRADTAAVHVLMDLSSVLEGDALTPLLAALDDPGVAAAGWRGVQVRDGWTEFEDADAGDVEALLGYLVAVRRSAALQVPLPAKAVFYRNADIEWSFLLREAGVGRLVAVDLPVRQDRHHGYHDSDPVLRDRESRKTYDRFLQRFRGREELRL
ncbi:MAG: glycosyltransferase [Mycobacteriales bacterium]